MLLPYPQHVMYVKLYSFSEDYFVLANSADQDEMPYPAAFHLGLHSVNQLTNLRGISLQRVKLYL